MKTLTLFISKRLIGAPLGLGMLIITPGGTEGHMIRRYSVAFLAAATLAAQPAVATDPYGLQFSNPRPVAFGGLSVRVPLGPDRAKPHARLQLTTYRLNGSGVAPTRKFTGNGVELGLAEGKPLLFTGGQSTIEIQQKLGMSSTTTVLVVGGVVLVLAVVALASAASGASDTCGEYEGNDDHCID